MSETTTQKRPVRSSAVVKIIVWSVVFCLLASILVAGLNGNGIRIMDLHGIPVITLGGMTYENARDYSVGNATITDKITDLEVNWVAGKITVVPAEGEEVTVTEDYNGDNDSLRLRWLVKDGKLTVQFRKSSIYGTSDMTKNLTIAIPTAMLEAMGDVEIALVSGDVSYTGNAEKLSLKAVDGDMTVTGDVGDLNMEAVDGEVIFRGGVHRGNIECVDADVTMYLDMAVDLDFNQVNGDVTLYLSEEITGFDAELDSLGSKIVTEDFTDVSRPDDKCTRWGDGSLRIRMDGLNNKLEIKKLTKD